MTDLEKYILTTFDQNTGKGASFFIGFNNKKYEFVLDKPYDFVRLGITALDGHPIISTEDSVIHPVETIDSYTENHFLHGDGVPVPVTGFITPLA